MSETLIVSTLGFLITIGLAAWKYRFELSQQRRNERLERLRGQLRELYGPLYALTHANLKAWAILESKCRVHEWDTRLQEMAEEDKLQWKLWMKGTFHETNKKIYQLITENADLYIENGLPRCFETFIAHHSQNCVLLDRWAAGDESILFSEVRYPSEDLTNYATRSFQNLKDTQFQLLGHRHELSSLSGRRQRHRESSRPDCLGDGSE